MIFQLEIPNDNDCNQCCTLTRQSNELFSYMSREATLAP